MQQTAVLGKRAEDAVLAHLIKEGYTLCARNFRIPGGEIDIIVRKKELLCFVEVKARQTNYFHLSEVVVPAKQKKIIRTARWYIFNHQRDATVFRFDVALVAPLLVSRGSLLYPLESEVGQPCLHDEGQILKEAAISSLIDFAITYIPDAFCGTEDDL